MYYRQLNKIRKNMQLKKRNYQKAKKREISQYYKKRKTIL